MGNKDQQSFSKLSSNDRRELLKELLRRRAAKSDLQPSPAILAPITKAARDAALPLSFPQERLWILSKLDSNNLAYNIASSIRFIGKVEVEVLSRSIAEIVRRHDILRTNIVEIDGRPVQAIAPMRPFDLFPVDVQGRSKEDIRKNAELIAREEARHCFDLSAGLLFRTKLLKLGTEEYLLILVMHHCITDGWSFGVFTRELEILYKAFIEGKPSPLPDLPVQYADYAVWQRPQLQGEIFENQVAYWKKKLGRGLDPLQLPTDRPRPVVQTHRGARHDFVLSRAVWEKLRDLSRREKVTPFMTLIAAFDVLLYRYTGQTDFAVGTPIANRNRPELEALIGFFINTLVLRTDLSGDPGFVELLGRVRETTLGAYGHQDLPFERLVEMLNPTRDMSYSPLFQVMFVLQNLPRAATALPGVQMRMAAVDNGAAMFDLTLYAWEEDGGLSGSIEYNTDLFDADRIERLSGHFCMLLSSIVADPLQRISKLAMLTQAERHKLLVDWNQTNTDYPKAQCYNELFAEQVQRTPDATAVICADKILTYKELNGRANRVARYLRHLGAGPGSVVGIYVDRTMEMVVGLIGILKAGSAYTPLDPSFPKDRIEYMLEDCSAGILLTQEELSGNIKDFSGIRVSIDADWNKIAEEDSRDIVVQSDAENLAYVIYTSGSTGKPKGVQISHRALNNFLYTMMETPGATPHDTILSVTTMSFDIFGLELFMPLLIGGRVVIAEREDTLDGAKLAALIEKHGVTIMQATPSTWRLMLEAGWKGAGNLKILCGGETFPQDLIDPLVERCDELWNMYGPTETTIWSTIFRIESSKEPILIGLPIANTQTYILDPNLQPVPVGLVGELHIGGDGLSHGYLNRPHLTQEKFIPNPFSEDSMALIYKTGDLARYRRDGMIECLGRVDHQVKLRGFRIELGEIEARIKDMDSVQNSVVAIREDYPGDKRLVAYCVARENREVSIPELTGYLRTKLPEYMVPQQFVSLETIPLTPNGKVDRKALPKPDGTEIVKRNYVSPQTETEKTLSEIWEQVLKIEKIGIHDNFFDLGGHSLLGTRIMSRLKERWNIQIPLRKLFEYPTIKDLANVVETSIHISNAEFQDNQTDSENREIIII